MIGQSDAITYYIRPEKRYENYKNLRNRLLDAD